MKSDKKILLAFLLNFLFSIVEFIGGAITGSVAIASDAIHDLGDSVSIGLSYILERVSKQKADSKYTWGYYRYSVLGSLITSVVLLVGALFVIYSAVARLLNPVPIHYDGMIGFAVFGVLVNFAAAWFTHGGGSLNQRAVNLHMLEDVLGWFVVLVGAVVMKFTDAGAIDALLSIGVSIFILFNALNNLHRVLDIFLERTPRNLEMEHLYHCLEEIPGVEEVVKLRVRSLDGYRHAAAVYVAANEGSEQLEDTIRQVLYRHNIVYTDILFGRAPEEPVEGNACCAHGHHHHHHHG